MAAAKSAEALPARYQEAFPLAEIAEDATASPRATLGADALRVDESGTHCGSVREATTPRTGESRHEAIAYAAYILSQARGFAPGHELDDWLAAERALEASA
jgi:hypothetical protein